MLSAPPHVHEKERLSELASYKVLDSLPEEDYDHLVQLASFICGTEMSLISLIDRDRQWFKARHGLEASETARDYAFCAHAINAEHEMMVVENARDDERFHDNPLVTGPPNISFYAGVPLLSPRGLPLGTLCVLDSEKKELSGEQEKALSHIAQQVMNLLELRKRSITLEVLLSELKERNEALDQFAMLAAHDIKTPLHNINALTSLLIEEHKEELSSSGLEILDLISKSSAQLGRLVERLLAYSKADKMLGEEKTTIQVEGLRAELLALLPAEKEAELHLVTEIKEITVNHLVMSRVLLNLVTNAIKYNDKNKIILRLKIEDGGSYWRFDLLDNGPGIPPELEEKVFDLFTTGHQNDRYGNTGTGIGLASVRRMLESLGGKIQLTKTEEPGACFSFTFPK